LGCFPLSFTTCFLCLTVSTSAGFHPSCSNNGRRSPVFFGRSLRLADRRTNPPTILPPDDSPERFSAEICPADFSFFFSSFPGFFCSEIGLLFPLPRFPFSLLFLLAEIRRFGLARPPFPLFSPLVPPPFDAETVSLYFFVSLPEH